MFMTKMVSALPQPAAAATASSLCHSLSHSSERSLQLTACSACCLLQPASCNANRKDAKESLQMELQMREPRCECICLSTPLPIFPLCLPRLAPLCLFSSVQSGRQHRINSTL